MSSINSVSSTSSSQSGEVHEVNEINQSDKTKPLTEEQKSDLQRALIVLNHFSKANYNDGLSMLAEIRFARLLNEMDELVKLAEEFGPLESAADHLINRLMSVSEDGEVIDLNSHMRDFLSRAVKELQPPTDTTANLIKKLEDGKKLSETEANNLFAYLEEAKIKVIPQGKRSSLLTEQISGLQTRYKQELADAGESVKTFYPRT